MRVAIATLGCKVNQYDSAVYEKLFDDAGCHRVDFSEKADAYVVNSCTVTDRADSDARRLVRRARRRNPNARIVLTGCYAQTSPEEISKLNDVDYVIGLGRLAELLSAVHGELGARVAVSDLRKKTEVETLGIESFPGRTRAFVKVQEGCNLFCTFCIVPVARGKSRSVAPRKVVDEIIRLEARGYREIVLTGVHLGGYGADLAPKRDLAFLLEAIAERNPSLRVRISSVDPPEITDHLVEIVASNPIFCQHFHIPIQSGSDSVLARMKRLYTSEGAAQAFDRLRQRMPDVAIGTDVITGFPDETREEFQESVEFIREQAFSYLHVFPYSKRSSTAAAKRWTPLEDSLVHERAREMRELDTALRHNYQSRFIGRKAEVLLEHARGDQRGLKGYTNNYIPVACDVDERFANRLVKARLERGANERITAIVDGVPAAHEART